MQMYVTYIFSTKITSQICQISDIIKDKTFGMNFNIAYGLLILEENEDFVGDG